MFIFTSDQRLCLPLCAFAKYCCMSPFHIQIFLQALTDDWWCVTQEVLSKCKQTNINCKLFLMHKSTLELIEIQHGSI